MNRTNRVRAKARKRRADERDDAVAQCSPGTVSGTGAGGSTATPCPICGEKLYGSAEELNLHVVHCLRRVSPQLRSLLPVAPTRVILVE